jgi:hypothetical protein
MLWPWIYRIVAALLAFAGAALSAFVVRTYAEEAGRLSRLAGDGFVVTGAMLALLLLVAGVVILIRPPRRGAVPRP